MVKDELNSEEKFFEKAVITEKFVKKYKKLLISAVVIVVVIVVADIVYTINKQNTIDSANQALFELQKNPNNKATLARLNSLSPKLHDIWIYSQAVINKDMVTLKALKSSKDKLIDDLASYEVAQNSKDLKLLDNYENRQNAIYEDLAQLQSALILMRDGKIDDAHQKLGLISIQSPLSKVAKALMHYGIK